MSTAQIHITVPLLKHAQDPSKPDIDKLTPEAVTQYLTDNLHWKAMVKAPFLLYLSIWLVLFKVLHC